MQQRAYKWVLILGCTALLTGLTTTARAGYITDATQLSELTGLQTGASGSSAASLRPEQRPAEPIMLLRMFGPLASKGSMNAGSGVGVPSVGSAGSSAPVAGFLMPVEIGRCQLTARLAVASQTSRPPPHVDRLFRPPRRFAAL